MFLGGLLTTRYLRVSLLSPPPPVDCVDPVCAGHGACHHGECHCNPGWGGAVCEILKTTCPEQCSNHGTFSTESGNCVCDAKWTGVDCSVGKDPSGPL